METKALEMWTSIIQVKSGLEECNVGCIYEVKLRLEDEDWTLKGKRKKVKVLIQFDKDKRRESKT